MVMQSLLNFTEMKAECTKTLIFGDGSESFTKGKEYKFANIGDNNTISARTGLIDNQGSPHYLGGSWYKHFKLVQS